MDKDTLQLVADPDELDQLTAPYSLERTMDIIFSGIPIPPSSNNMYCNSRRGGRIKSAAFRIWERDFAVWALDSAQTFARGRQLVKERLKQGKVMAVHCTFYFNRSRIFCKDGKPKKQDASNYIKALHDAMAETLLIDDCWFFDGMTRKRPVDSLVPGSSEMAVVEIELIDAPWAL